MTLRLAIFDVDGTLIDSQAQICTAMEAAFRGHSLDPPNRPAILGIVGLSLPVAVARLGPDLGQDQQADLVALYRNAYFQLRNQSLAPLYPGARATLEALSRRPDTLLGVATGKSRRGLEHVLAAHDLGEYFVTLQMSDDHPSKPHPSMIHACLRQTGVDARDAVMIGDTRFDMDMAKAADVAGLGVSWGYHPRSDLGAASCIVDSFDEIPATLDAIWERAGA